MQAPRAHSSVGRMVLTGPRISSGTGSGSGSAVAGTRPRFDPSAPGQLPGGTAPARTMRRREREGNPDLDGADGGGIALDGRHDSEREPPIGRRVERRFRSGRGGPAPRPPGTARPSRAGGAPSFASRSPHEPARRGLISETSCWARNAMKRTSRRMAVPQKRGAGAERSMRLSRHCMGLLPQKQQI
jgi:hypothetical protein